MNAPELKIGPLKDKKPVKFSIGVDPDLHADLKDYAKVYEQAYGQRADVKALTPSMLRSLMDSDAGFKRARKAMKN
ncbi:MAG: DUF2274 domain-containing protein [Pseudomonadota bacterium]